MLNMRTRASGLRRAAILRSVSPRILRSANRSSSLKRELFLFSSRGVHGTIGRMNSCKGRSDIGRRLALFAALGLCSSARDLDAASAPSSTLQEILVIGTTPVPGMNIDIDKVPGNVQSVLAGDLAQNGTASLT